MALFILSLGYAATFRVIQVADKQLQQPAGVTGITLRPAHADSPSGAMAERTMAKALSFRAFTFHLQNW